MKITGMQWRFCKAVTCKSLKDFDCTLEKCDKPNKAKALNERRAELQEVKNGRKS